MKPPWFICFHAIATCSGSCSTMLAADKTFIDVSSSDTCVKDQGSTTVQDQSQGEDTASLYWLMSPRGVIVVRSVLMYYVLV
jgi:hypothetical protein